jgi:hypothetical protein
MREKTFEKCFQASRAIGGRYNTLKDEDLCVYEVLPRISCVPRYVSEGLSIENEYIDCGKL